MTENVYSEKKRMSALFSHGNEVFFVFFDSPQLVNHDHNSFFFYFSLDQNDASSSCISWSILDLEETVFRHFLQSSEGYIFLAHDIKFHYTTSYINIGC